MDLLNPRDVHRLACPAWLNLSADGKQAAYAVFTPNAEDNCFTSTVHLIDTLTGAALAVPFEGDIPQFSPVDGTLAYLSSTSGERQIWLRSPDGNALQLTTLRYGITRYNWSHDGRCIVFEAPLWPEDVACPFVPRTADEKAGWLLSRENSPVVIEALMYKFDETYGVADGSVPCIGIADAASGEARMLTSGGFPCHSPALSPDGTAVAFYGKPYSHHRAGRDEVFIMDLAGGTPRQLTEENLCNPIAPPAFTPDGGHIIYAAYQSGNDIAGHLTRLFKVPMGGGEAVCILPADDMGIDNAPHGHSAHGTYNPVFQPSRCGKYIYYTAAYMGSNELYRLHLEGEAQATHIPTGTGSIHCFCPPMEGQLLFSGADFDTPCQLYIHQADDARQLTRLNPWLDACSKAQWQALWAPTRDGKSRIQGWVLKPPACEAGKRYPAILNVHGGPTVSFVRDFNLEFQAQAASGHAVLLCNPRGSSGYGQAFTDSALAWGQEAIDDLFDFVDAAVGLGFIDGTRIGITGGSYGGYMTLKIIDRSTRFKAACAQRALCNTTTSYGTGDMGFLSSEANPPEMLDFLLKRAKTSYINQIDSIEAPLLLLHGTHDYRCSFEQAEQMFIAMKDRRPDIPVRLVAFPGENHGVSRIGRPESQRVHMQEMVDWFTRYLGEEACIHG